MSEPQNHEALHKILRQAMARKGIGSTRALAAAIRDAYPPEVQTVSQRTIDSWISPTERMEGQHRTRSQVEDFLGLRPGSIMELLDRPWPHMATLDDMLDESAEDEPASRARDLSEDEMFAELSYRMKVLYERNAELERLVAEQEDPFRLAAHKDDEWRGEGPGVSEE